jgi:hypothetical protein
MFNNRRMLMKSVKAAHRENMLRTLSQRMEVARAQGNQMLIQQLEKEQKELGL